MSRIKRATKVTLVGAGEVTLKESDYITAGGEGAIYRKGKRIIKLFLDQQKMHAERKIDKIELLQKTLQHPSIVAPSGLVKNGKGEVIGYYMPYVSGESMPQMFSNNFRQDTGFDNAGVAVLTDQMREVVQYAHSNQVVMADANELNWIADVRDIKKPVPYVIDVDAWQIGSYKASVIMPSYRDWSSNVFTEDTDWFAWGVLSFLLYTGIHPYKGSLTGYKPKDLVERMRNNASVFMPEVRLNKNVRDFSCIPGPLLDWYRETFQNGHRGEPPSPLMSGTAKFSLNRVMRTVATTTGGLMYDEILRITNDPVVSVWPCGIARTASGDLYEVESKRKIGTSAAARLAVIPNDAGWLIAENTSNDWQFQFITRGGIAHAVDLPLTITGVFRAGNRLFVTTEDQLIELSLQMFAKPLLTFGKRWQIMGNATSWYQGVGVADLMGAMHLYVPHGTEALAQIKVPELDGRKVINAIAGTRYVEVITLDPSGQYESLMFSFDSAWQKYTLTTTERDTAELNTAILDKGVTATIQEDGELVVAVPWKGEQKVVQDKDLATTMRLSNIGDRVVYRYDGALYSLKMT